MNYDPENARHLSSTYLISAEERLESAKVLLEIKNFEDSISRSYYAILDAATACLIAKDVVPKSHSGAMRLFSMHFIKSGEVDTKFQRYFARIEKWRLEADYKHSVSFTLRDAQDAHDQAREFVERARELLKLDKNGDKK